MSTLKKKKKRGWEVTRSSCNFGLYGEMGKGGENGWEEHIRRERREVQITSPNGMPGLSDVGKEGKTES